MHMETCSAVGFFFLTSFQFLTYIFYFMNITQDSMCMCGYVYV